MNWEYLQSRNIDRYKYRLAHRLDSSAHSDTMTTHPNQKLHDLLVNAARKGTLNAQYIQEVTGSTVPPSVERDASAYVNWNTTLNLLSRAPAQVWFSGVSKQGRYSNGSLITL